MVLIAEMQELHRRSTSYGTRAWQVPLAYIGITGVAIAQLISKPRPAVLAISLIATSLIGGFIAVHLFSIIVAAWRAFQNIEAVDAALSFPTGASRWTALHLWAMFWLIVLISLAYLWAGLLILQHASITSLSRELGL